MDEKNSSKQTSQGAVACGFENLKITVLEITYRPISEKTKTFTWHSVLVKLLKRLVTRQKKKLTTQPIIENGLTINNSRLT